jgi:hypothetical protein
MVSRRWFFWMKPFTAFALLRVLRRALSFCRICEVIFRKGP